MLAKLLPKPQWSDLEMTAQMSLEASMSVIIRVIQLECLLLLQLLPRILKAHNGHRDRTPTMATSKREAAIMEDNRVLATMIAHFPQILRRMIKANQRQLLIDNITQELSNVQSSSRISLIA